MQQYLRVRRVGCVVILMLTACGRPAIAQVTHAQPEPTALVETTVVAVAATVAPTVASTASVPDQTPTVGEQVTALPAQNAAMLERARERGTLRVIVTLAIPWKPEGELPGEAAIEAQRDAIADAQSTLVSHLASYNVTDMTSFKFIPSMAMVVDAPALQVIFSDPTVQSVQEDKPATPSLDGAN